jgi:hypothetical protein
MKSFTSKIFKIGINPCMIVPAGILKILFLAAGKSRGPVPVRGKLKGAPFIQTVVRYSGAWRLYINGKMLADAGVRNGDTVRVEIEFDDRPRTISMHPELVNALKKNKKANDAFKKLSPYRQKEIIRYISHLKTEESVSRNVDKAIRHLSGQGTFAGRP